MAKMKVNVKQALPQVAGLTVGNLAAGFAAKLIPIENAYIKNAIPLVAGVFLMGQKGLVGHVGAGMASAAGSNLLRTAIPAIGALEDEIDGLGGDDDFLIEGAEEEDDINGTLNGTLNGNEDEGLDN